jgi:hypothetical protein
MATFPALSPVARSYSMGRFAMTTQAGLGGNQIKFLHSIKKSGVAMTLTYENLTQAEMASIRDHYRGQQGSFVSFLLPSAAWAGQSSVTNIVPSGTRWKYVAPPEETQKSGGLVDVTVSLLVESNFTPATSGGVFWPSGGGGGGGGTDPYFSSVSLLLPMDGTNGSTTFTDASSNGFTVTANGNAQISTAQKKFGTASGLFDGNGDWITAPSASAFSFGTGDFTVEAWIYQISMNQYSAALEIGSHISSDSIVFLVGWDIGGAVYSGGWFGSRGPLATNQWQHVAWTRSSGTLRSFVDGTLTSSTSFTNNLSSYTNVSIGYGAGYNGGSTYYFNGYIDDLRVTKGISRYNAAFTPPTAAFPTS